MLTPFCVQVGPKIEFSRGDIFKNEEDELTKMLPFLALPDGAHLVRTIVLLLFVV